MPIDINLLRVDKGGDPEVVRKSELKRGRDGTIVDKIIAIDVDWRAKVYETEQMKKNLNALNKDIGTRKKANKDDKCEDLVASAADVKCMLPKVEKELEELQAKRDELLDSIGNLVHESVPESVDEADNAVIRTWGVVDRSKVIDGTPGKRHHHELLALLDGYNPKKGVEIAGHRGYFLKGYGVMLNQALVNYGLHYLRSKKYCPIQPPYFMRRDVIKRTAELKDFEETLYKIPMGAETSPEKPEAAAGSTEKCNDLFLIATSEQPISALHMEEFLEERTLPYRYAGVSTCFRKEAGAHGKDTWGIFRIHQFEKIEQFIYCAPEESWSLHDEMIDTAEGFFQSLELPYRVVAIVSGALNDAAAKKYDLEAWFPGYNDFRELVSCSNCTDFQSRALNCRLGHPKLGEREKRYVHMLNATLVATQRALCCILENYQKEDGIVVPRVLVPFMDGLEFLPFASE